MHSSYQLLYSKRGHGDGVFLRPRHKSRAGVSGCSTPRAPHQSESSASKPSPDHDASWPTQPLRPPAPRPQPARRGLLAQTGSISPGLASSSSAQPGTEPACRALASSRKYAAQSVALCAVTSLPGSSRYPTIAIIGSRPSRAPFPVAGPAHLSYRRPAPFTPRPGQHTLHPASICSVACTTTLQILPCRLTFVSSPTSSSPGPRGSTRT